MVTRHIKLDKISRTYSTYFNFQFHVHHDNLLQVQRQYERSLEKHQHTRNTHRIGNQTNQSASEKTKSARTGDDGKFWRISYMVVVYY